MSDDGMPGPTDDELLEARALVRELAGILGSASAEASYKMGVRFDVDDPQVAKDLILASFDAMFLTKPRPPKPSNSA
jgi:hypothetical protein